ncbi:hypothetical protein [Thermomonospora cellulosilytica]|uniref:Uncharacterized protein n=1 Tax=Thermomonospora cellulosilytica TaxID=1411118 RepID=A0A7W3MWR4_9ACTN|nr:hypothetical protein [Thermomonospora cellulosilytica]MBA9003325.1 hypothetical protein [Thermomonospora cellulosilytica]
MRAPAGPPPKTPRPGREQAIHGRSARGKDQGRDAAETTAVVTGCGRTNDGGIDPPVAGADLMTGDRRHERRNAVKPFMRGTAVALPGLRGGMRRVMAGKRRDVQGVG